MMTHFTAWIHVQTFTHRKELFISEVTVRANCERQSPVSVPYCRPTSPLTLLCVTWWRVAGAYLLYISWADRPVLGSPFKVTVLPASVTETSPGAGGGSVFGTYQSNQTQSRGAGAGSVDLVDSSRLIQTETSQRTSRSAAAAAASGFFDKVLF